MNIHRSFIYNLQIGSNPNVNQLVKGQVIWIAIIWIAVYPYNGIALAVKTNKQTKNRLRYMPKHDVDWKKSHI